MELLVKPLRCVLSPATMTLQRARMQEGRVSKYRIVLTSETTTTDLKSATSSPAPHSTKSYTTATKPDGTSSRGRSLHADSSLGHNHRSRQDQNHPIGHIDDPSLWAEWPRPSGSCRQTYAQNTAEKHTVLSPSNLEASVAEALVRLQSKCTDAAGEDGGKIEGG